MFGDDGLGWTNVSKVMVGAGGALLDSSLGLPLLFCVGVAIGVAKKADGSTALAAVVGFLVYWTVLRQFPEDCPEGSVAVPNVGCQVTDGDRTVTAFALATGWTVWTRGARVCSGWRTGRCWWWGRISS